MVDTCESDPRDRQEPTGPTIYKGIQGIFSMSKGPLAKGLRCSICWETHEGEQYKGALMSIGLAGTLRPNRDKERDADLNGFCGALYFAVIAGNLKGANIGGLFGYTEGDVEGLNAGGLVSLVDGNVEGVCVGGVGSKIKGRLNGSSYGTISNRADSNGRLAVQVGTTNKITNYNTNGTTIQIGVYNRSGNQTMPILNIRGWKNLFKKTGKKFVVGTGAE